MTATKTKEKPAKEHDLSFWTTGEDITNIVRHTWVSDTPKQAIDLCMTACMGMDKGQALLICTGKSKLTGSTREGDGTLIMEDDNATELLGIKLSVEVMVERLEKKYIETSESINCYQESEVGMWDEDHDEDFAYRTRCIKGNQEKLNGVLEQLECLYPVAGKSFKDLPTKAVRGLKQMRQDNLVSERMSATGETAEIAATVIKQLQKEGNEDMFNMSMEEIQEANKAKLLAIEAQEKVRRHVLLENSKKLIEKLEEEEEEEKILPLDAKRGTGMASGGCYYIVHCPVEKCKEEHLHSGWLLPDGTFYGGRGIWIHQAIIRSLNEIDFFKDKEYCSLEDDLQNRGGWIRVSSGHGWMLHDTITKEQVEFIIDYTITVENSDKVDCGYKKPKIETFAKLLDGREVDMYDLMREEENEK